MLALGVCVEKDSQVLLPQTLAQYLQRSLSYNILCFLMSVGFNQADSKSASVVDVYKMITFQSFVHLHRVVHELSY